MEVKCCTNVYPLILIFREELMVEGGDEVYGGGEGSFLSYSCRVLSCVTFHSVLFLFCCSISFACFKRLSGIAWYMFQSNFGPIWSRAYLGKRQCILINCIHTLSLKQKLMWLLSSLTWAGVSPRSTWMQRKPPAVMQKLCPVHCVALHDTDIR